MDGDADGELANGCMLVPIVAARGPSTQDAAASASGGGSPHAVYIQAQDAVQGSVMSVTRGSDNEALGREALVKRECASASARGPPRQHTALGRT